MRINSEPSSPVPSEFPEFISKLNGNSWLLDAVWMTKGSLPREKPGKLTALTPVVEWYFGLNWPVVLWPSTGLVMFSFYKQGSDNDTHVATIYLAEIWFQMVPGPSNITSHRCVAIVVPSRSTSVDHEVFHNVSPHWLKKKWINYWLMELLPPKTKPRA